MSFCLSWKASLLSSGAVIPDLRGQNLTKEQRQHFPVPSPIPGQAVLFTVNNLHLGHLEKLLVWGIRGLNFTRELLVMAKDPAGAEFSPAANQNTQPGLHQGPTATPGAAQHPENGRGVTVNTYKSTILHSEKFLKLENESPASPSHQFTVSPSNWVRCAQSRG